MTVRVPSWRYFPVALALVLPVLGCIGWTWLHALSTERAEAATAGRIVRVQTGQIMARALDILPRVVALVAIRQRQGADAGVPVALGLLEALAPQGVGPLAPGVVIEPARAQRGLRGGWRVPFRHDGSRARGRRECRSRGRIVAHPGLWPGVGPIRLKRLESIVPPRW